MFTVFTHGVRSSVLAELPQCWGVCVEAARRVAVREGRVRLTRADRSHARLGRVGTRRSLQPLLAEKQERIMVNNIFSYLYIYIFISFFFFFFFFFFFYIY